MKRNREISNLQQNLECMRGNKQSLAEEGERRDRKSTTGDYNYKIQEEDPKGGKRIKSKIACLLVINIWICN